MWSLHLQASEFEQDQKEQFLCYGILLFEPTKEWGPIANPTIHLLDLLQ